MVLTRSSTSQQEQIQQKQKRRDESPTTQTKKINTKVNSKMVDVEIRENSRNPAEDSKPIDYSEVKKSILSKESPPRKSWNAPSNVGNLSIREKWCISIYIFSTMALFWALCLSYSLCGSTPCSGLDCNLIQDLTICKMTWSTLAYLTQDARHSSNGTFRDGQLHPLVDDHHDVDQSKITSELQAMVLLQERESQSLKQDIEMYKLKLQEAQDEIWTLKQSLSETSRKLAWSVADVKHCKSDVKDEIFKKKACGNKLYTLQSTVEELQGNLTTLQADCGNNKDPSSLVTTIELQQIKDDLTRKESEIATWKQASRKDKDDILTWRQQLYACERAHADMTATWKHCKSDVKDEIFKKKRCGDKLHAATATVEDLEAKMTLLQQDYDSLKQQRQQQQSDGCNQQDAQFLPMESDTKQEKSEKLEQENNSLKMLLQQSIHANADARSSIKHCQSDVKDEIFKKKACGEKLHSAKRTMEELQGKVTALEAQLETCSGSSQGIASEEKRMRVNPLKQLFARRSNRHKEL